MSKYDPQVTPWEAKAQDFPQGGSPIGKLRFLPTTEWDGKSDLIILRAWITEQCGTVSSAEDALAHLEHSEEGMPPLWIEKTIAPIFYPLNLRYCTFASLK